MQLYAGTSKDFITDATRNAIGGKLAGHVRRSQATLGHRTMIDTLEE